MLAFIVPVTGASLTNKPINTIILFLCKDFPLSSNFSDWLNKHNNISPYGYFFYLISPARSIKATYAFSVMNTVPVLTLSLLPYLFWFFSQFSGSLHKFFLSVQQGILRFRKGITLDENVIFLGL